MSQWKRTFDLRERFGHQSKDKHVLGNQWTLFQGALVSLGTTSLFSNRRPSGPVFGSTIVVLRPLRRKAVEGDVGLVFSEVSNQREGKHAAGEGRKARKVEKGRRRKKRPCSYARVNSTLVKREGGWEGGEGTWGTSVVRWKETKER